MKRLCSTITFSQKIVNCDLTGLCLPVAVTGPDSAQRPSVEAAISVRPLGDWPSHSLCGHSALGEIAARTGNKDGVTVACFCSFHQIVKQSGAKQLQECSRYLHGTTHLKGGSVSGIQTALPTVRGAATKTHLSKLRPGVAATLFVMLSGGETEVLSFKIFQCVPLVFRSSGDSNGVCVLAMLPVAHKIPSPL